MKIHLPAFLLTAAAMLAGISATAQRQCESSRTPEQQERRVMAITFFRAYNTAQHRYHQQQKRWAELAELTASEGWAVLANGPARATLVAVTPTHRPHLTVKFCPVSRQPRSRPTKVMR